ncbi:DUF3560 domain-containing protein [Streptomyces sp. NPDC096097]|uniref:DUF3560 domain-containing protein n=1 Tax=Streptomyces sp. NPDC096097 TaxID=3155546 RepID=UPI00331EF0F2
MKATGLNHIRIAGRVDQTQGRTPGKGSACLICGTTNPCDDHDAERQRTAFEAAEHGESTDDTVEATADIVIRHTHESGTVVEGSNKGDGVWEALKTHGWTYRREPGIFVRGSRLKDADRWRINRGAEAVRALGFTVAVVIEEAMSFAEREEAREAAATDRAERYDSRAGRAQDTADAARDRSNRIAERFWMGQPILVGHHSENRARRDQERMHNSMRKSIEEGKRATYWTGRAAAAENYEAYRKEPRRTMRRIEKLEADLRRVRRNWTGDERIRRAGALEEEISYWREVLAQAEADSFKIWSKADFKKGDYVLRGGTWYEVLRVNAKSLTIPHIHNSIGVKLVTKATARIEWTWTLPYDDVFGRKSAEEMAARLQDLAATQESAPDVRPAAPAASEDEQP